MKIPDSVQTGMTTRTHLGTVMPGAGSGSGRRERRPGGAGTGDSGSALSAFFSESEDVLEAAREPRREDVQKLRQRADGRPRQERQRLPCPATPRRGLPPSNPASSAAGPRTRLQIYRRPPPRL